MNTKAILLFFLLVGSAAWAQVGPPIVRTMPKDFTYTETHVFVDCTGRDTEYSYTLPAGTVYYEMKPAGREAFRYGTFSGSTSHTQYKTLTAGEGQRGFELWGSDLGGKVLYFRTPNDDSTRMEIELYIKPY